MTGQADVRWIWMAVALVVVAVPVFTVLFNREIRALQNRIKELEKANAAHERDHSQEREQQLDLLRTLSALRPAEPEFTEEYYVEAQPDRD
jgi:hypothetical protein